MTAPAEFLSWLHLRMIEKSLTAIASVAPDKEMPLELHVDTAGLKIAFALAESVNGRSFYESVRKYRVEGREGLNTIRVFV